jgi:prepilin-type N-terminal cleavage/methylation domain-containing protein
MKTPFPQRRGFTLVEIMIVVVIVGILSSIAIPAMMRVKRKTEDTVALNFLHQLYDAKERYFTEDGAGNPWVNVAALVKSGYASHSLLSTTTHPVGHWNTPTMGVVLLRPGLPVKLSEEFKSGRRVDYGRSMVYPEDK